MSVTASAILAQLEGRGILRERKGPDAVVMRVAATEACGPGDLVFADDAKRAGEVAARKPSVVVTTPALADLFAGATVLTADNVKLAQAWIEQGFFDRELRGDEWPRVHPSAVVHPGASVPKSAHVGPCAVIGRGAKLGERVVVLAGAVIENDARLGDGTVVHPHAVVGWGVRVGRDCILKAGCILGSEGFGFAQDAAKANHRIPQLGTVVIEDRVVVGANCCIDRATFGETRIGAGTVLDNLCHIAHNVKTGKDCILTAFLCIAGSTTIGDRVITSGQTGMIDHLQVASDTVFVHRAGVNNDVKEPGAYGGAPIQPLKEYMRNMAVFRSLAELRATVRELEAKVAALEGRGK